MIYDITWFYHIIAGSVRCYAASEAQSEMQKMQERLADTIRNDLWRESLELSRPWIPAVFFGALNHEARLDWTGLDWTG